MTKYIRTTFVELPTFTRFKTTPTDTATEWFKVSTRTARIDGNGRSLYFLAADMVYVEAAHFIEMLGEGLTND